MKIGELAKRTGLAPSAIRFYESAGLLKMVQRRANGYRTYPEEALLALELIMFGQQAGFSLEQIGALLPSDLTQWQGEVLVERLRSKIADIEQLQAKLAETKAHLLSIVEDIESRPEGVDCSTNAQRVLSRLKLADSGT
ncbi:MerR family DNA-binding transcriptional regulator [Vibrio fluvialis]|nr:MerR family DNA-binding transcriptional regulator [Vibrio fluvialis]